MPRLCSTLVFGFVWMIVSSAAMAQEWTRFRGPNGQGVSEATTIPTSWTAADYNWRVKLPGPGISSPVLWGDKIFLMSADPDGTRLVSCLSTADGSQQWLEKFKAAKSHVHTQNNMASSTPAVDADHVYVAWASDQEFALLALTHAGKPVWRKNLGTFTSQHGFGTSPVVYGDLVIITNDQDGPSFVAAFDRNTGDERWRLPRKTLNKQNASYSTPAIRKDAAGNDELIIHSWAHGVSSVNPKTGKVNWEHDAAFARRPVSGPVFADGLIFGSCGEGAGNNYVLALKPGGKGAKPKEVYKIEKSLSPYVPSVVVHGNLVFLWTDKGMVSCIDAQTGKPHWEKQRVEGAYSGSPIRVGEYLYAMSADGDAVVLKASDKFELVAKNPLGEGSRATPAVADGRMYLRTENHLISLGGKGGKK